MTDPYQMKKLREAQDAQRKRAIKESFNERLRRDEMRTTFYRWFGVGVIMFLIMVWAWGC